MDAYELLAEKLDALPNGYPPTEDGVHLRLLAKIFSSEEAELTAQLNAEPELVDDIAARLNRDVRELLQQLKAMAKKGLISIEFGRGGLRFGLLPFVVGIYENQAGIIDKEMALLFEEYYQQAFSRVMQVQPQYHRVVPVNATIDKNMEIRPYENILDLVDEAKSWAVLDCICRKQKALIGQACEHPIDVCMVLSPRESSFENHPIYNAVTKEEALATLKRAADAGLVHSVSNNQQGIYYICNCCTCSCGILQGVAKLGVANVIASSAFVSTVDETLCIACETCLDFCQFGALSMDDTVQIDSVRCVGCGVCVPACPSEALKLVRRPEEEVLPIPETLDDWGQQRAAMRGLTD
jgi:electron transport complex protein RnfB